MGCVDWNIVKSVLAVIWLIVASLMGCVDWNSSLNAVFGSCEDGRIPNGMRGLKFTIKLSVLSHVFRRIPNGMRGLKF